MTEENPKKKFEVKLYMQDGALRRAIFIDDELLDWSVDISSYMDAAKMGPKFIKEVQKDIARHFVDSVSDMLGRNVTIEEIQEATKTGWI